VKPQFVREFSCQIVVGPEPSAYGNRERPLDAKGPTVIAALVSDIGAADGVTSDPTIAGTGLTRATVPILLDGAVIGTTTADPTGARRFTPIGLADRNITLLASTAITAQASPSPAPPRQAAC